MALTLTSCVCDHEEKRYVIPLSLFFFHLQSEKAHRIAVFKWDNPRKTTVDLYMGHSKYPGKLRYIMLLHH